jgi:hypothetical protein
MKSSTSAQTRVTVDQTFREASNTACAEARVRIAAHATFASEIATTSTPCAALATPHEI